jgi:hypothetical protein
VIELEETGDETTAAGSLGHFGLGMIEVEGGDFGDAYVEFARAASPSSEVGEWATLATAQAAAAIGKTDEARESRAAHARRRGRESGVVVRRGRRGREFGSRGGGALRGSAIEPPGGRSAGRARFA